MITVIGLIFPICFPTIVYAQDTVSEVIVEDYNKVIYVGESISLEVSAFSDNLMETEILYKTSDANIATVNNAGKVKGISPGKAIIYVSCKNMTKELEIEVRVKTLSLKTNAEYKTMKVGEVFGINVAVNPLDASNIFTYKSLDNDVAEVSSEGVVTAKSIGSTSVIVSNGDSKAVVTIIVNNNVDIDDASDGFINNVNDSFTYPKEFTVSEYKLLTADMLKYYYDNDICVKVDGEEYGIYFRGRDIINYNNELSTDIEFIREKEGISFVLNNGQNLCGAVTLNLQDIITKEKHIYLYNESKKKYEEIKVRNIEEPTLDVCGKYLITENPLEVSGVNASVIAVCTVIILVVGGIVILITHNYLLW